MLATLIDAPFDDPEWLFETKWDGVRAICAVDPDRRLTLRSRNGKDLLVKYPGLAKIGEAFRSIPVVVDGEIVSLDEHGKSSFQRLQNLIQGRTGAARPGERSLTYVAFDVLFAHGGDLRKEPLEERKLKSLETARSPFTTTPTSKAPTHFVRPRLVAEIKFGEWTRDGFLRQPVFLGLRDDKPARSVVRERERTRTSQRYRGSKWLLRDVRP